MSYSLATLWYERQRYLPGVLAVAFSALLIALQCGLLLGLFSITSIPIDHTHADIWMGAPKVLSVDLGEPIREGMFARLAEPARGGAHRSSTSRASATGPSRAAAASCAWSSARNLERRRPGPGGRADPELRSSCRSRGGRRGRVRPGAAGHQGRRRHGRDRRPAGSRRSRGRPDARPARAWPGPTSSVRSPRPAAPAVLADQTTYVLAKCHNPADAPAVVQRLQGPLPGSYRRLPATSSRIGRGCTG